LRAPPDVPALVVDEQASELVAVNTTDAAQLRADATAAVTASVADRATTASPARYKIRIEGSDGANGGAFFTCALPEILFVVPLIAGMPIYTCPISRYTATADVVLETREGIFKGTGEASRGVVNGDGDKMTEAWRAAVYSAVQDAMSHAKKEQKRPAMIAGRQP
jgi:hypothetical protein